MDMLNKIDVKLKDFQPCNEWERRDDMYMDQSTGRIYTIFTDNTSRCLNLLTLPLPILSAGVNLLYRGVILITLSHFWLDCDDEMPYDLKNRLINAGIDLARLLATPLIYIALQVVAIYELFKPLDGAKLYASIERLGYSHVARPGIQPINLAFFPKNIWNNSKDAEAENRKLRSDLRSVWQLGNNLDTLRSRNPQNGLQPREGGGDGGRPDHPRPPAFSPSSTNLPSSIERQVLDIHQGMATAIADKQKREIETREKLKLSKENRKANLDEQVAKIRATVAHLPPDDKTRLLTEEYIKEHIKTHESIYDSLGGIATACGVATR